MTDRSTFGVFGRNPVERYARAMDKNPTPTIRDLYPHLSEKELKEGEDNLDRYLTLVLRIFERLQGETNPRVDQLTPNTGTLRCTAPGSEVSL